jgi:hypothetical protein
MRLPVAAVRLAFATGYVLLCALGAGLLMYPAQRSEADRYVSLFFGVLLALIGVGGLVLVLFIPLFDRCRPGPVLATAPSGNPARFFRRSPFMVVTSVVFCLAFAGAPCGGSGAGSAVSRPDGCASTASTWPGALG